MRGRLAAFWAGPGGGREVVAIAAPLVLSHMSFTLQGVVDRLYLTWYSPQAMAGAVSGLFVSLGVIYLFVGTGEYVTTFVAQYLGARRLERIGPTVWQGIYFAIAAGAFVASLSPLLPSFFALAGYSPELRASAVAMAEVLFLGAFAPILMATLSSFFSGRGQTRVVLVGNVLSTTVNCVLAYLLVFGKGGFPEMGVRGAAAATVTAQLSGAVFFLLLILRKENRKRFATLAGWRPDRDLLGRLLRFGFPAGLQTSLEFLTFALFLLVVGRIGTHELASTGIAFNLNGLVFVPMLGLSLGLSALVGRHMGAGRPDVAERAAWTAFALSLAYMLAWGAAYLFLPRLLIAPYAAGADPATFGPIGALAGVLLRYVAVYSIFDMMNVVFAGALKGAGDTRFPVHATLGVAVFVLLVPAWLACVVLGQGIHVAWICASAYPISLGPLMLRRFLAGRWKRMKVIEDAGGP